MKRAFLVLAALLCVSACDRQRFKVGPAAAESTTLPTDSAMIHHERPDNKSSTSVGIGMD
jgi:hypothetical protein